jgi:hypothetical protein
MNLRTAWSNPSTSPARNDILSVNTRPQIIADLVERFQRNENAYCSGQYNEAQLRKEFLDPFFETLGWDMGNRSGAAEAYKNVINEDAIKVAEGMEKGTKHTMIEACRIEEPEGLTSGEWSSLSIDRFSNEQARITFGGGAAIEVLLNKLSSNVKLGSLFDVRTGLQAYKRGKGIPRQTAQDVEGHVFDRTTKEDDTCYRYLEGSDVSRYFIAWSGMWMSWGPWLSQPRELSIFQRPRL